MNADDKGNVHVAGGESVFSYSHDGAHRWATEVGSQAGEFRFPSVHLSV